MPELKTQIFGNLPVEVTVHKNGNIKDIRVLGLSRGNGMSCYLEFTPEMKSLIQSELNKEIEEFLDGK